MPYSSGPGGHTLPEVNFLMVEIPTLKPYIYSLFSYLFIKQDQMIMTCNSAVAYLPSHPDHKYIWFRVGISVTFFQRGGAEPRG
jgi:hypothetical protein